jgi:hypothetical protein
MTIEYKLPVGPTAHWLEESLRLGPSLTLARLIANSDLERFSFLTFGKEGLSETDLLQFEEGNKAQEADRWLMDILKNSPMVSDGMLLVEDWMANPQSNFIREKKLPAIVLDDEVYYVLRERDLRKVPHWKRIFTNAVPSFHAFLLKDDARFVEGMSLSRELLQECARHLRMIICGAYDGESYVLAIKQTSL